MNRAGGSKGGVANDTVDRVTAGPLRTREEVKS